MATSGRMPRGSVSNPGQAPGRRGSSSFLASLAGFGEVAAVPKDGSVEVSVSNNGVGIAPEDQEAVFEEFPQVGTAEKKAEGTGLGLTLRRKFIELRRSC